MTTLTATTPPKTKWRTLLIAWIGLLIFNAMFTKTGSVVPVPIIAAFTLVISGALIKEQPHNRPTAILTSLIATIFLALVFVSTMYLGVTVNNLFDIEASSLYITLFYSLAFLTSGAFITNGLTIFRTISGIKSALITLIFNALLTAGIFFGIKYLIDTFIVIKVKYLFVPEVYESIYQLLQ